MTTATHADRIATLKATLDPLPLSPSCRLLANAFVAYVAATGNVGEDSDERALLTWLQRAGFTVPGTHHDILAELRAINVGLRITAPKFNDPPFLLVARDALMAAMLHPAKSVADVGAKLAYLEDTKGDAGLGEWVWLEGEDREKVQYQLGRDVARLQVSSPAA